MFILELFFYFSLFMLGYIFILYPISIFLLSKTKPHPVNKSPNDLFVSIVIPAYNEEDVIEEKINNVLAFDFPKDKLQIIVVDDGSSDRTAEIVKGYLSQGVEYCLNDLRQGKVAAINKALQMAKGEIFVISDADITTQPDALEIIVQNFSDPKVGCVVGRGVFLKNETDTNIPNSLYYLYDSWIKISESKIHSTVGVSGHSMAIRRNLLEALPTDIILDDFYIAMIVMKQKYRVIFESSAISYERSTLSVKDELVRRRRITAGRYHIISISKLFLFQLPPLLFLQVISHKFLRLSIPFFMIFSLFGNLAILTPSSSNSLLFGNLFPKVILLAQLVFYLAAFLGLLGKSRGRRIGVLNFAYYLVATNLASLAGLYWFLSNQRSVLWDQAKRKDSSSPQK